MSRATATTSALHLPQDQWQRADLHHILMVSMMQILRKTENRHRAFNIMPQHSCFETCKTFALNHLWTYEIHIIEQLHHQVVKTTHGIRIHNLEKRKMPPQTHTKPYFHLVLRIQLESNVFDLLHDEKYPRALQSTPDIRNKPSRFGKLGCESVPFPRGWEMRGRQAMHQKLRVDIR